MRLTDGLHHLEEAHNWRAPLGQRRREEDGTTRLGACGGGSHGRTLTINPKTGSEALKDKGECRCFYGRSSLADGRSARSRLLGCHGDVALSPEGGTKVGGRRRGGGSDVSSFTPGPADPGPGL